MEEKRIEEMVIHLMKDRLRVNSDLLTTENYDMPLTGKTFGFYARDLVYLFFEVEKSFGIQIDPEQILDGSFNTISGVIKLLKDRG